MFVFPVDIGELNELTCDVCIIGSGAAGITLARELGKRGIDTICISGGAAKASAADEDLYRGHIPNFGAHEPLEENRARVFGGSTTLWGGRLVPFDPIDFEKREFVPLSGWPISYKEMARYIPRASKLCESPEHSYELAADSSPNDLPSEIGPSIVSNHCERWSMPTDFAQRYTAELRHSEHVRILFDLHCVDLELNEPLASVQRVETRSIGGVRKFIRARTVVLAAGGLENPRLLLASRRQMREGIGNQYDLVGRCYMGHIIGTHGFLRLNSKRLPPFFRLLKDEHGIYMRRRLWLTPEAQRDRRIMNIIAYPYRTSSDDPQHRDPVLSLLHLAGTRPEQLRRDGLYTTLAHLRNVAISNPLALADAGRQLWGRFRGSPRLPFVLPYRRHNREAISFQGEHAPNLESRVVLSDRTDQFGMPRLEPRVAFSEIDSVTVLKFYSILDNSLQKLGLGRVEFAESELRKCLYQATTNYDSHAHHIGTTRMSDNPREGVVDSNCRVHGIENLYIAGSSVFATSGHANPTLTILALTLRLADCLIAARSRNNAALAAV
jgi:choline dehydrogenase-like flavoprotein